nr:helix-turn-helix transcriptional regulator [Lactobacillus johnsonii]
MEFAEQIKRLRKENNLTQEEMVKKPNITRQAIFNWENNRNLPDFEMII